MTREAFIHKWLGNPEKPYSPENRDEMRDDLDKVIEILNPNPMNPSHYQFAEKEVIDMMASIWCNEAARTFLTLSALFKYQMRAGRKTYDPAADLEKARHCLEMATEYDVKEMPLFHFHKHNYTQKNTPNNPLDNYNPNSSGNKPPQPTSTTANSSANYDDPWFNATTHKPPDGEVVEAKWLDPISKKYLYGLTRYDNITDQWTNISQLTKTDLRWRPLK